jgi:hypothetical protein
MFMRNLAHPFLWFLWVLVASFVAFLTPAAAFAGRAVICESVDNRLAHCDVGWSSAFLESQLSRSACVRGQTWGIRRGVIWVDNGCRASFVRGYVRDAYISDLAEPIDVWDGGSRHWTEDHHHEHEHDHYERGERLTSGFTSPRERGTSVFAAPRERFEQTVECSSIDKRYTFCPVGRDNRSGRLVSRRSEADCREGKGWGWKSDGVWVSRGCRGVFAVEGGGR